MATLTITADEDFRDGVPVLPVDITEISFTSSESYRYATFGSNQFGGTGLPHNLTLKGDQFAVVRVYLEGAATSFSAAGWGVNSNWSGTVLLVGGSGNNTLTGSSGDDVFIGGGGADSLLGGDGSDDFYYRDDSGTETGDSIDGGADGNDGLLVRGAGWDFRNTTISNVEILKLDGGTTATFSGAQFGAGAITLIGGNASYEQTITVIGSNVDLSAIELVGRVAMKIEGVDNVANNLKGWSWDQLLLGGNLSDTINGGYGNDTLDGRGGADTMAGSFGDDSYQIDNAGDVITEAADEGSDRLVATISYTLKAGVHVEVLNGSGGAISLTGNEIANAIYGTDGNNRLDGGGGADNLVGNDGNDTFVVDNAGDIVDEGWSDGIDTVISSIAYSLERDGSTIFGQVENLTLSGTSAINGTGNGSANVIVGNSAVNILDGAGGADQLRGMGGNDVYRVDASDVVDESVSGSSGSDTVVAAFSLSLANTTVVKGAVENLTLAGDAAINGTGNSLSNFLTGNAAANVLNGAAGADNLRGLAGNDVYYVDNARDVVDESLAGSAGVDTVVSSISFSLANTAVVKGWAENLTLSGTAAINGTGNSLANVITGNAAANVINGGAGADTMRGLAGNDVYTIDSYGDVVDESRAGSSGVDTIASAINFNLGNTFAVRGTVENLTLTGTTAMIAAGTAGANILTGNAVANVLAGLGGNDRLAGGLGSDTLVGGSGNDVFVFNTALSASTNRDVISDFANVTGNNDTIYLENAIFTRLTTGGTLNSAYFKVGTAAADANDFIVYNKSTGALFYDADGSGSGRAIQIATIANNATLTSGDFVVI
jgi:Ca2+-binding RTX toxin-like protein